MRRIAIFLATLLSGKNAMAVEQQWHVGVTIGNAILNNRNGAIGVAHLTYGLTDAFDLTARVSHSIHSSRNMSSARAGAAYVIDIADWTPSVGALFEKTVVSGDNISTYSSTGIAIPFVLTYRIHSHFSVGGEIESHIFLDDTYTSYLHVGLQSAFVW